MILSSLLFVTLLTPADDVVAATSCVATPAASIAQNPVPPDPPEGYWYVGTTVIDGTTYWKYENANGRTYLIPIP